MATKAVSGDRRAEQRAIKEICNHIRKQHETDWFGLFNDVMGLGVAEEYEKNLAKGSVGEDRLGQIKDWLLTHEPDLAYAMAPHLFPRSLRTMAVFTRSRLAARRCIRSATLSRLGRVCR